MLCMTGDSTSRYMYLSLLGFVDTGEFPGNEAHLQVKGRQFRNPLWEGFFRPQTGDRDAEAWSQRWVVYYNESSAMWRHREVCDCYRIGITQGDMASKGVENRYYINPLRNISLTYIRWLSSSSSPHGHFDAHHHGYNPAAQPDEAERVMGCRAGLCAPPWKWEAAPGEALVSQIFPLCPTHVFYNAGLWGKPKPSFNWGDLTRVGNICKERACRVFWRGTTPRGELACKASSKAKQKWSFGTSLPPALKIKHGWALFDAYNILCKLVSKGEKAFMPDGIHLNGNANQYLNEELIRIVHESRVR